MDRYEEKLEPYNCKKMGEEISIHREYKLKLDSSGNEVARIVKGTDCTHKDHCGIATKSGTSTTYDWSECDYTKSRSTQ